MTERLTPIEADITTLSVDAIVNAANAQLRPGGGVDGAIRDAGGPDLNAELARIGYCAPGTSVLTNGYRLPSRFVIHTVAPIYSRPDANDERLLASCYTSALKVAEANGLVSIAFPAIGTGAYGWPAAQASEIAFHAVTEHIAAGGKQDVIFCCFSGGDRERYTRLIAAS